MLPSAWVQCLMVPSPYVTFCADAHAGIQVRAIPENRMKVMRRMGDLPLGRALAARTTILRERLDCIRMSPAGPTGRRFTLQDFFVMLSKIRKVRDRPIK